MSAAGDGFPADESRSCGAQQVSDLLTQYSDQVRYGEITDLETAAQQFMDEANAILAAE